MRTTITISDDLLAEAKVRAARQRRTLGEVVDDALRASLHPGPERRTRLPLPVFGDPGRAPLVDLRDRDAVAEALDDNRWPHEPPHDPPPA